MLAGALRKEGFQSEAVHEALDLCLSCKACKTECPVQVDMAAYKAEFLAQRYKGRLHPLHHYIFGFADRLARYGSLTPGLTNALLTGPVTSPLIKHIAGVAQQRNLPKLAQKSFVSGHDSRAETTARKNGASAHERLSAPPRVLLWPDTWNNYYIRKRSPPLNGAPEAGFEVDAAGPHLLRTPLYDFGSLDQAARAISQTFWPACAADRCGNAVHLARAELRQRLPRRAPQLLPEGLTRAETGHRYVSSPTSRAEAPDGFTPASTAEYPAARPLPSQGCLGGPASEIALLRRAGTIVDPSRPAAAAWPAPLDLRREKFEVSKSIANAGLLPAVESAGPMTILVTDGFSCREQIRATRPQAGDAFC